MTVTLESLLSCLTSSALLTILAWVIIKGDFTLKTVGKYIGILLAVIIVRMLLPVEFSFTITYNSRYFMTRVRDFFFWEINVGTFAATVGQILLFVWIAGVICNVCLRVGEYLYFVHKISKCPGYFEDHMDTVISEINRDYGKTKKFHVLLVPGIRTPAVFGLLHPRILMPVINYSQGEVYFILRHEMLHYYHHDMLVKILCEFLCTVYWWNPAVYLFKRLVAQVLEIRVDSFLATRFSEEEKIGYMECILKSMKAGGEEKTPLMITFAAQKENAIKQRFDCIWDNHWQRKNQKGFLVAAFSCLLFLMSVSVIVEPLYSAEVPGTFSYPNPETSYLIERDGCYGVYIDGEFVGEVFEITEPFMELEIYKNEEDLKDED